MALLSFFLPIRIEETWRLWQKFLDDYSRFEDWLKSAERIAAYPNSSEVLYTNAKEELKRFEVKTLPPRAPDSRAGGGLRRGYNDFLSVAGFPHLCPGPSPEPAIGS